MEEGKGRGGGREGKRKKVGKGGCREGRVSGKAGESRDSLHMLCDALPAAATLMCGVHTLACGIHVWRSRSCRVGRGWEGWVG
eukprot:335766-Chlamydomonas_euryale.AAC.1